MLKIGDKIPHNVFIGSQELSKIYKGETLIFNNKSIELTSLAGEFDATVSGFVNPVWEYNGEIQNGNTGKFTILNDNDIVILSWDGLEENTEFVVNSAGRSNFNTPLVNFRSKIAYNFRLYNCSRITGDLADLGGKITYYLDLNNCSKITGDLADLGGKITYYLNLNNCSDITGDLSDLGGKISYWLNMSNCSNITGDLADLGGNISYCLDLNSCSNITGNLADLGGRISNYLNLSNCSNITGDLADLGGKISYLLNLSNCSDITGIYTPINSSSVPSTINLSKTGLTVSDMDETLKNISITTKSNGKFTANGMSRTSASDSAVEKLVSQGWTISGITKTEV